MQDDKKTSQEILVILNRLIFSVPNKCHYERF